MTGTQAILITGAAKRVGRALALYFAQQGYDIALHYHHSAMEAQQVKTDIEALGRQCRLFPHDLADIAGIPALVADVHRAMPYCVALINNASSFERADFMATDEALFDRQFLTNFKAPFFLTQAFARQFSVGCVVNMLDSMVSQTQGSHFAYLLAKKALMEFTLMAARSLGPAWRVNGLCPGIVLPSNGFDEGYMHRLAEKLPLRQVASLEQIAEGAFFLCAQAGLTGQLLTVDGGEHLL